MQEIQLFLENNIVVFIGLLIAFLIKNQKNIKELFPSTERNLERLGKSKEFMNSRDGKDKELDSFYRREVENQNFQNITKLNKNERNEKLLSLFNKIADKIKWDDFIKVKDYIETSESLSIIKEKAYKLKNYSIISLHTLSILFTVGIMFYASFEFKEDTDKLHLVIGSSWLLFGISYFMVLQELHKLRIINKYNGIVKELNEAVPNKAK